MALIPLNTFKTKTASLITGTYDQSKCARDTALIIDSIAFDLFFGGTSQSNFAGLQYWAQGATRIPQEKLQTLAAMDYTKNIASQIIAGTFPGQVSGTPGSAAAQQKVIDEFDIISNIIEYGTAGTTNKIIPNGTIVTDTGMLDAANILLANKSLIQASVISYIDQTFVTPTYTYDRIKCLRDTKLIVDSVAFDLLFDGSSQSEFAGLQYWGQGSTRIPSEEQQTLAAINYAKTISKKIVRNEMSTPANGNNTFQLVNLENPGNLASVSIVDSNFTKITDIITNGVETITDDIVPNGERTLEQGFLNAYNLLQDNKRYIQNDVVAWINDQIDNATVGSIWDGFIYDSEKCFRDVGFIVDCISFDLIHGGNRQSVQAGSYYYGFAGNTTNIPGEQSLTVTAFNYLKSLVDDVVQAKLVPVTYQTNKTQIINAKGATITEANLAASKVDIINNIIENGPDVITTQRVPINLNQSTNINKLNGFKLLIANKDFLAAEVIAYIDNQTKEQFSYNPDKCFRDVGFIVDCIVFDLRYGGNRQAIQSGVYYFENSATVSIVPTEKTDTIEAYTYLRSLLPSVILGIEVPKTALLQNEVVQINDLLPATPSEATLAQDKLDVIIDIIENGPTAESAIIIDTIDVNDPNHASRIISLEPVFESPSLELDVTSAFNMLMANRAFLTAEVIGFMNTFKVPKNTKVYTSPPGVTAIVLMAQVANITDHDIKVTFSHYRNLPVIADPSTENGYQAGDTTTDIVREFTVPPNDSANLLNGRMIIESFDSIVASASENNGLKLTLSILETATT